MSVILGLNWGHDASAALVVDNRLVAAISRERITRRKKDAGVDAALVQYVLNAAGRSLDEIDAVAFALYLYSPDNYIKIFNRQREELRGNLVHLHSGQIFSEGYASLGGRMVPTYFLNHHIAHAASAFFTSPFDQAACFTVDASMFQPEACSLFSYGNDNRLHYFYCPGVMIGNAYSVVTEKLGLGPGLTKAGTTMGLAAYGQPSELAKLRWREFGESFYRRPFQGADPIFINYMWSQLSGLAPHAALSREQSDSSHAMQIAASMQYVFEESLLEYSKRLCQESASFHGGNICLSGGSFLNADVNQRILRESGFSRMHLFPGCGDDGTAVGSALWVAHSLRGAPRQTYSPRECMYLGAEHTLSTELRNRGTPYSADDIARALADGKIVAWYQGRSEFGPRALGNRSLFADPRRQETRERINAKIKRREWFRPLAPVVISERKNEWFELEYESKFMLQLAKVRMPERLAAVTHIDGSARPQTLERPDNPRVYELLQEFEKLSGVPVLLNTSLNTNNEPLVETPEQALQFFENTETDLIVLEDIVIAK